MNPSTSILFRRTFAAIAIVLIAALPVVELAAQQSQSSGQQQPPEAPSPAATAPVAPAPTLAQQMQRTQQPLFAPAIPFRVPMPHSRSPLRAIHCKHRA